MLPLSHSQRDSRSTFRSRIKEKLLSWKRLIFSDQNTRNLFLFLILNLSFAFVELLYGIWTNSLGLISDSFHMFFDCTGLLFGLAASVITRWRANDRYSYGYVRAEVLGGFVNGLLLLFIALFIMSEAVERAIEPPEIKHERLFVVSVLGLIVNLVGICAFKHGHGHGHGHGHSHDHSHSGRGHHGHSHSQNHDYSLLNHNYDHHVEMEMSFAGTNSQIMKGVFLHILADTLGSVGVIISAVLMQMFGWMIADPICSMLIAVLIVLSVVSLMKESWEILMQRQPVALDHVLPPCYNKVVQIPGVYSVQEPHFWTLCSDVYVGWILNLSWWQRKRFSRLQVLDNSRSSLITLLCDLWKAWCASRSILTSVMEMCLSAGFVTRRRGTWQCCRMSSLHQKFVIAHIGMAIILDYKSFEDRACLRREAANTRHLKNNS